MKVSYVIHKVAYSILILLLGLSILLHFRAPATCLKILYDAGGEGTLYGHIGSAGLTEFVRDDDKDGMYEAHDYTVEMPGGLVGTLAILNPNETEIPDRLYMRLDEHEGRKRSVSVKMLRPDASGVFQACEVSFNEGKESSKVTYSDWDIDGRFDSRKLAREEPVCVTYKGQWIPVLFEKPYDFPKFVTVMLGDVETRLVFRDGEFFPEDSESAEE